MVKKQVNYKIKLSVSPQVNLGAPLVGLAWVDHVGDDVQVFLCDVNLNEVRRKLVKGDAGSDITTVEVDARAFQKIFLSKLAVSNLHHSLGEVIDTWDPGERPVIEK